MSAIPLKLIKECLELKFITKYQTIFNLGDPGEHYFIVIKGKIHGLVGGPTI